MNLSRIAAIVLAFALASLARANVLVVAPSGAPFTQISAAVAAASDGDVVLVRSGAYDGFTISNKELAVVADTGADVRVTQQVRVLNLAATRTVVLAGLSIRPIADAMFDALLLDSNQGAIRIIACELRGPYMTHSLPIPILARGLSATACANVALSRCTLLGGTSTRHEGVPGMFAASVSVFLGQTSVLGSRGADGGQMGYGYEGGDGTIAAGSRVIMSACSTSGGSGGNNALSCAGGAGVRASSLTELDAHDARITSGRNGSPCLGFPVTPPIILSSGATVLETVDTARELRTELVAREQTNLTVHFFGEPGDQVELVLADDTRFVPRPDLRGASLVRRRTAASVVLAGTIAGDGTLSWTLPIVDLGAGVEAELLHAQARFTDAQGSSFLSSPASIVLLDTAF